jgi:hypothetical protein
MSFGLLNIGGTCYLNSVIQLLRHIPEFRKSILSFSEEDVVVCSLKQIFLNLEKATSSAKPIVESLEIKLGADSSGFVLSRILDNIPKKFTTMFLMKYTSCDEAFTLIIVDKIGKNFMDTVNLYKITIFPSNLIIDFTGNPNFSFNFPSLFDRGVETYELIAAVIYVPGHYYSVCKNSFEKWQVFNDASVDCIEANDISRYLLFRTPLVVAYRRIR